jgi:hypothetical protein
MPRPQFTTRTLLVAILVAAAFFGGMAAQHRVAGIQATNRELELNETLREVRRELAHWVGEANHLRQAIEQKESKSHEADENSARQE